MNVENLVLKGNAFQAKFEVPHSSGYYSVKTSAEYRLSGSTVFQVNVVTFICPQNNVSQILVRFFKLLEKDKATYIYIYKLTSSDLGITNKVFFSDDGTWHLIYEKKMNVNSFDIMIEMDIVPSDSSLATLHNDKELTDFKLRGEDGSVHMHKTVLAAWSPVFRTMLNGTWRESAEGLVDVIGTSKVTLKHFKDFLYLHQLPESGIEQLLLLASYYMIPKLEQICIDKLVLGLSAQNACDLLEFGGKHKLPKLLLAILESAQIGAVKVEDIRNYLDSGN